MTNNITNKVIVVGGGSFQGKSLIAAHIGYKYRIPLIISSDTIRNILHVLNPEIHNFFIPTYLLHPEILGKQMNEVSKILSELLTLYEKRGESLIIEGIDLSREFIANLSKKSNVLLFCIDNKLSLKKRLEYKSITRKKVAYLDIDTGMVKYGQLSTGNLTLNLFMRYKNRINKIHQEILSYFSHLNIPIVKFEDISNALKIIDVMVCRFLKIDG